MRGFTKGIATLGLLALGYMLLPILVIAIFSFNDPEGKFNYTWQGFTFDNWTNICDDARVCESFANSILVGVIATIAATTLGTMIAIAIVLSFSEEPEPSLASISLTDEEGRDVAVGVASVHSDDPRSIVSQVTPLEEGVYTVAWRIVLRVDGQIGRAHV